MARAAASAFRSCIALPGVSAHRKNRARFDSPPRSWYALRVKIDSDYQYLAEGCTADDLLAAVVRASYSNTRARRAVLGALCEVGGQATPAQLLALGLVYQPSLGLITVY